MGIKADYDDFLTSSQATAYLLRRDYPGKTLYVCGTRSLEEELEKEGFSLTCDTSRAECIVMGYDTAVSYTHLAPKEPASFFRVLHCPKEHESAFSLFFLSGL